MRDEGVRQFIEDQLQGLGDVEVRAMFGGYGLYHRGTFFGIIDQGQLYFKTDDVTRPAYRQRGMQPFRPTPTQTLKTYYAVPSDVLEDEDELVHWAEVAVRCARAPVKKATKSRRSR